MRGSRGRGSCVFFIRAPALMQFGIAALRPRWVGDFVAARSWRGRRATTRSARNWGSAPAGNRGGFSMCTRNRNTGTGTPVGSLVFLAWAFSSLLLGSCQGKCFMFLFVSPGCVHYQQIPFVSSVQCSEFDIITIIGRSLIVYLPSSLSDMGFAFSSPLFHIGVWM